MLDVTAQQLEVLVFTVLGLQSSWEVLIYLGVWKSWCFDGWWLDVLCGLDHLES